jgi:hypothetical protein
MLKPQSLDHLDPRPKYKAKLPRDTALSAVEINQLGKLDGMLVWPTLKELTTFWPSSPWKEARESLRGPDRDKKVFSAGGFSDWLKLNPKRPDMTPSKQDALVWRQKHPGLPMPKIVWIEVKRIRLDYQPVEGKTLRFDDKPIESKKPEPASEPLKHKGDIADLRTLYFQDGETLAIHQRHSRYVEAVQKERRREPQLGIKTSYGPTQEQRAKAENKR